MIRFRLIAALMLFAIVGAVTARAAAAPNFIIILVDDLGWTGLGCYGSDLHETPHIDRFAAGAMKFTNAYAGAPVCTPTRASIMTGKAPARLNMTIWFESAKNPTQNRALIPPVVENNLPHDQVTIAEVLREAGYYTAHVGKWHLGDAGHYPETHGFDANVGGTFWGAPFTFYYPFRGQRPGQWGGEYRYVPRLGEDGSEDEYLTDRLTDHALDIIERHHDRPFFLNMCYYTVHTPIEGKADDVAYFRSKLRPGLDHDNPDYAAMHRHLDQNVGRILAKLEAVGVADNTVIIFASDNGGFINNYRGVKVTANNPLRSGKGSAYEGGVRIPMIVRWPGVTRPGSVCDEPVITMDFYPTMLEIAGLEGDAKHNADLDGVSLVPLLRNPVARLPRRPLFWHYPHYYQTTSPVSAMRDGDWKLLEYFEDDHVELYNLAEDLGESNDLAAKIPDKAESMRRQLRDWRASVNASLPTPNPEYQQRQRGGKKKGR